jgi:Holliday junction DNA helicase RuvB
MKLLLRFDFYSDGELVKILRGRVQALRWEIEEMVLYTIGHRARGTPRLALRLLQASRRVCRAEGEAKITLLHTLRACDLEGIDGLGLGPVEQRYLKAVAGGATRLNVIASLLGLPAKTISEIVEPFLLRIGLIVKDDSKRQLTAEGLAHLRPISV